MKRVALVLAVAVLVAVLPLVPAAQAPEKVTFALNWFPVGDHAAYWVALDRGYYKAKGLDVEMQNSKGSGTRSPRWTPDAPTSAWPTAPWSSPRLAAERRSRSSAWCSTRHR